MLAIAADSSEKNKALVWEFIMLATSDENQSSAREPRRNSAAPELARRPRDGNEGKARPVTLMEAVRAASKAGRAHPDRLETRYNEMARMVTEEVQSMIEFQTTSIPLTSLRPCRSARSRSQKGS